MSTPTNENEEEERKENIENPDDSFGLPEIDYEPLKRDEPVGEPDAPFNSSNDSGFTPPEPVLDVPTPPVQERKEFGEENSYYEPNYNYSYEEERPSIWPKVLLVLALLVVAGGAVWYFVSYRPNQLALEQRREKERLADQEEQERKRLAEQEAREREEAAKQAQTQAPAALPAGTIETLTSRSGRYYVIVASSIDGDLIMDYAKKLSAKGVTSHIIAPYGKVQFHRLAVADGDTYANAQATADGMKGGDYGDKLWVLKY
ncbi:MAG: SPOR domain-containing protein [Chryseolinea sp.]